MRTSWTRWVFTGGIACFVYTGAAIAETQWINTDVPATLTIWNRDVVTFRVALSKRTPSDRVRSAMERIEALPPSLYGEDVVPTKATVGDLSGYMLMVDSILMFGVVAEDRDPDVPISLEQFAADVAERLEVALRARAEQQRLPVLLRGIGYALLATLIYGALAILFVRFRRSALRQVVGTKRARVIFLGLDIWPSLVAIQRTAIQTVSVVVLVFASYLWLQFVLLQFPYSEPWGERLTGFLRNTLASLAGGFIASIPGVFTALLILFFARMATRMVAGIFSGVERGIIHSPWLETETAKATRRLIVAVIWLFAAVVSYPYIPGSSTQAFKGISVLVGLMVSLGSTGFVNQLMSGLVIVYARTFRTGDFVLADKTLGTVSEIGLLSTKIITRHREEVTIPNAVLANTPVTNFSRLAVPNGSILSTTVSIGYDTPWRQVHAMLEMAAERTEGIREDQAPRILQLSLADFYIVYELSVTLLKPEGRIAILSKLHQNIQDVFNEHGVQIMSPHFERQPSGKVYVPAEKWYEVPAKPPADDSQDQSKKPKA